MKIYWPLTSKIISWIEGIGLEDSLISTVSFPKPILLHEAIFCFLFSKPIA